MKTLAVWLVKKYAVAAVQDAVKAKKPEVAEWATKIGGWIIKVNRLLAFLNALAGRLSDGELTDQEAADTIKEAKNIADSIAK